MTRKLRHNLNKVFEWRFRSRTPDIPRKIGIESEFPLVGRTGEAVEYELVRGMFRHLGKRGFALHEDSCTGEVVFAERKREGFGDLATSEKDVIESELGYCTVEVSLAPESTLFCAERRLREVLGFLLEYLDSQDCKLLGYGIQPRTPPSRSLVSRKSRYLFYERYSNQRFLAPEVGSDVHLFTVAAANQCHIDVHADEAIRVLNTLNGLAGLQLALTANSPIWKGSIDPCWKAVRESFYDLVYFPDGKCAFSPIGVPQRFRSLSDYVSCLYNIRAPMVKRRDKYIEIVHELKIGDFFESSGSVSGRCFNGQEFALYPQEDDLLFLAGFLEFNARLSPAYGTVETRISCQQPPGETLVVPALVLGVIENLKAAEELLSRFAWEEWRALRIDASQYALEARIGGERVNVFASELVQIARVGLQRRSFGEEVFLEPLEQRTKEGRVPADRAIEIFRSSGMNALLDALSFTAQ